MGAAELKSVIAALVAACAYFIVREFSKKDQLAKDVANFRESMTKTISDLTEKFSLEIRLVAERNTAAIESLNSSVSNLALHIAEQKAWFAERYICAEDHEKAIASLKDNVQTWAERFEKELENHKKDCPRRPYNG